MSHGLQADTNLPGRILTLTPTPSPDTPLTAARKKDRGESLLRREGALTAPGSLCQGPPPAAQTGRRPGKDVVYDHHRPHHRALQQRKGVPTSDRRGPCLKLAKSRGHVNRTGLFCHHTDMYRSHGEHPWGWDGHSPPHVGPSASRFPPPMSLSAYPSEAQTSHPPSRLVTNILTHRPWASARRSALGVALMPLLPRSAQTLHPGASYGAPL